MICQITSGFYYWVMAWLKALLLNQEINGYPTTFVILSRLDLECRCSSPKIIDFKPCNDNSIHKLEFSF